MDDTATIKTTDWDTSTVLTLGFGLVATIALWILLIWILAKDQG